MYEEADRRKGITPTGTKMNGTYESRSSIHRNLYSNYIKWDLGTIRKAKTIYS